MRRKDRELQSITDILQIIHQCKVCRVSFIDGNHPYLVPLNFGYAYKDGKLTLYFHGAKDGHKMELAAAGGCAAFSPLRSRSSHSFMNIPAHNQPAI